MSSVSDEGRNRGDQPLKKASDPSWFVIVLIVYVMTVLVGGFIGLLLWTMLHFSEPSVGAVIGAILGLILARDWDHRVNR